MKKFLLAFISLTLLFSVNSSALAYVAASSNYRLEKDSINVGGTDFSSSSNYLNSDTVGELVSGLNAGSLNNASTGYRYMDTEPTVVPVLGCTDPKANNYNPSATQDNGSCNYPPHTTKVFGCTDPRAINYNPSATQDDGSCRYLNPILGCTDHIAINYNPSATRNDGSCRYHQVIPIFEPGPTGGGPLSSLPVSTTSLPIKWDLRFVQPQEKVKTFDLTGSVRLSGEKPLTILFNFNLIPDFLKTIGVAITDPQDKNKIFSFLMHRSLDGSSYEATISPLIRPGTYPIDIYVINYANQTTQHLSGRLVIPSKNVFWAETVINQIAPIIIVGGLVVGFLPTLYDLLFLLFRFIGYFFGRRRHDKPWGTIYDSVTKRPLDPVYITALQMGPDGKLKEVASAISDIDGRYSFFLPEGTYYLKAEKTHYKFPSEKLQGRKADELYDDLYFGAPVVVTGQEVININIPMDSIDFDWNEFAKTKTDFFRFYNRREVWLKRLYNFLFSLGFILSAYLLLLYPSAINIAVVLLYVGVVLLNWLWRGKRKPFRAYKANTGEPLSFAIMRVFIPDLKQQIKSVVTDKLGRFYILVRPGVYYYTIEEKQLDGSYVKTYQSDPVNFPKGILTGDIFVK